VLRRVYDGEREFAPKDGTARSYRAFEREVEALIELEARGLVRGLRVLPDNTRADRRYYSAGCAGVTPAGRRAIETGADGTAGGDQTSAGSPSLSTPGYGTAQGASGATSGGADAGGSTHLAPSPGRDAEPGPAR
jgi:hypothetical protein